MISIYSYLHRKEDGYSKGEGLVSTLVGTQYDPHSNILFVFTLLKSVFSALKFLYLKYKPFFYYFSCD